MSTPFQMPDTQALLTSLRGNVCPCCKDPKAADQTFCKRCYFALGHGLRNALYNRVGDGYEEAFESACLILIEKKRWVE